MVHVGIPEQQAYPAISNWKHPTVPTSSVALSDILNIHVPFVGLPFSTLNGLSGLNDPANGATPADIAVAAWSSITVGVPEQSLFPVPKLSPLPPRLSTSSTLVLSGWINLISR